MTFNNTLKHINIEHKKIYCSGLEIEVINKFEDFASLENAWNTLLERSKTETIFLRHEWIRSWWEAFGRNKKLFILQVKKNNKLIGIAPLMLINEPYRKIAVKKIKFIENEHTFRSDFIIAENPVEVIDKIITFLFENKHIWDVIELNNVPNDSDNYKLAHRLLANRVMLLGLKRGMSAPYINIDTDWETFLSTRTRLLRKNLRYIKNRLDKMGNYAIKEITNFDDSLFDIFNVSKKSWKADIGQAITQSRQTKDFFIRLTRKSDLRGWLSIWLLKINNIPVAYEYQLKYKNKVYALKADYNEEYKEFSPGVILDQYLVKQRYHDNVREYDLGGGCDHYKMKWKPLIRNHANLLIFKRSFLGVFIYILEFKIINTLKKLIQPLRNIYKKLKKGYRYEGFKRLYKRIIKKITRLIFTANSALWFEKDLTNDSMNYEAKIPIETDMTSTAQTIEWLRRQNKSWLVNSKEINTGIKNRHYFPLARNNGRIVGCAKIGYGDVYVVDFGRIVRFPKNMAFIYDTYVPAYNRGKGVAPHLITDALKFLKMQGFNRIRCHIPKWNKASIRTYTKLGFKEINFIRCFKILGISIITSDPVNGQDEFSC
jgi:CelD/BcsL family acetyltransferase involved in cellulose biosynthesis/ribosomal protein S18 acetylase RimI-like enzyme